MRFDLRSVLLNDGVVIKVTINPPDIFINLNIPVEVWHKAIVNFNKQLNERRSVTEEINDVLVDILQMDDRNVLQLAVDKNHVDRINDTWFSIKGQLIFKSKSSNEIEELIINDLIYKDLQGNTQKILNKS